MATGFQPIAGVSGRVKAIVVPDAPATDLPVVGVLTTTVLAEIVGWSGQKRSATGKVVTVENPADAFGVVSTLRLRGGIGEWTAKIDVVVNSDSTAAAHTAARLPVGAFVKLDLIRHKGSAYGHYGAVGKIVSDDTTGAAASENPQTSSYSIEGHGLLPEPTFGPV